MTNPREAAIEAMARAAHLRFVLLGERADPDDDTGMEDGPWTWRQHADALFDTGTIYIYVWPSCDAG